MGCQQHNYYIDVKQLLILPHTCTCTLYILTVVHKSEKTFIVHTDFPIPPRPPLIPFDPSLPYEKDRFFHDNPYYMEHRLLLIKQD